MPFNKGAPDGWGWTRGGDEVCYKPYITIIIPIVVSVLHVVGLGHVSQTGSGATSRAELGSTAGVERGKGKFRQTRGRPTARGRTNDMGEVEIALVF